MIGSSLTRDLIEMSIQSVSSFINDAVSSERSRVINSRENISPSGDVSLGSERSCLGTSIRRIAWSRRWRSHSSVQGFSDSDPKPVAVHHKFVTSTVNSLVV